MGPTSQVGQLQVVHAKPPQVFQPCLLREGGVSGSDTCTVSVAC